MYLWMDESAEVNLYGDIRQSYLYGNMRWSHVYGDIRLT